MNNPQEDFSPSSFNRSNTFITRAGVNHHILYCHTIPLPPLTPKDKIRRAEWINEHFGATFNPNIQAVDVFNLKGELLGTFLSPEVLADALMVPSDLVTKAIAESSMLLNCFLVSYSNQFGAERSQASLPSADTPSPSSAESLETVSEEDYLQLIQFKPDNKPILKQGVSDRLERLARCECPVHGKPMIMKAGFELHGEHYIQVECSNSSCVITGIGCFHSDPVSLLPEFAYLLVA
ncbi:hypothetical protein ACW9KT_09000 [Hymenobacter sp. HD11105]